MEFLTKIVDYLTEMMVGVYAFLPKLFDLLIAFGILIIGWVLAKFVTKMIVSGLRSISFDKHANKVGLTKILKKGDVNQKPSNLFGCIAYWVMMVVVLIHGIKAFNIPIADDFLHKLLVYIPHVVVGALTLIIGMLLAKVISTIVYIAAKNTDMPIPHVVRDLTKYALVVYVAVIYLKEIGLGVLFASHGTILFTGLIFALALAFGLAGKDVASKYLEVLKK